VILWSSEHRTAPEFAVSRIARLFPSFWTSVALTTAVVALRPGIGDPVSLETFLANLTMVPNLVGVDYIDGGGPCSSNSSSTF
jgi:peptidoglycan/LPS O-acetylase OafA/YrhL